MKPRDEQKIQKVYIATLQLVMKKGLAGITMEDIAGKAKIATGTLYIYFKNKEALINELFVTCRTDSVGIYFTGYEEKAPFYEGFKTIWMNILRHREDHFEAFIFLEQCYHSPFIAESNKETSKQLLQPLFKLIERGKRENRIKDLDTVLLLTYMVGSINEMVKHRYYHGHPLTKALINAAFDLTWDGIKK